MLDRVPTPAQGGALSSQTWASLPDGRDVRLFILRNAQGAQVAISNLGATLVSWHAADRDGNMGEVLLGYDTPRAYFEASTYMGAIVGRWANRIARGRFVLNGVGYQLDRNEGRHLLHGGANGLHRALWEAGEDAGSLAMRMASPDGDAGFPGRLEVQVRYTFDDDGTLTIRYDAASDAPTPVNLTSHPYFNLCAKPGADIRGHQLRLDADRYLQVDAEGIPTQWAQVSGSAFDFRREAPIGARLDWPDAQLALRRGFDHCYALRAPAPGAASPVREVAQVHEPDSGRELTVRTDQRGLQFYTGNSLSGTGHPLYGGLCLEAGAFPDQVNMADAASVVIVPGQPYRQETQYRIGTRT